MGNKKGILSEETIKQLKSDYRGNCSNCGKSMNSYNMSSDGTTHVDCEDREKGQI